MKVNREYVKKQAESLIDTYALTTPVHVFELADLMGIRWQTIDTNNLKSVIEKKESHILNTIERWDDVLGYYDNQTETIYLNTDNHPITRKRFTMAHEIGHVHLHHNLSNLLRKVFLRQDIFEPRDEIEAEANYFASYLLMPDREIEKKLKYSVLLSGPENVARSFAQMFAVSPESMRIRFKMYKNEHPEIWKQYNMEQKIF